MVTVYRGCPLLVLSTATGSHSLTFRLARHAQRPRPVSNTVEGMSRWRLLHASARFSSFFLIQSCRLPVLLVIRSKIRRISSYSALAIQSRRGVDGALDGVFAISFFVFILRSLLYRVSAEYCTPAAQKQSEVLVLIRGTLYGVRIWTAIAVSNSQSTLLSLHLKFEIQLCSTTGHAPDRIHMHCSWLPVVFACGPSLSLPTHPLPQTPLPVAEEQHG